MRLEKVLRKGSVLGVSLLSGWIAGCLNVGSPLPSNSGGDQLDGSGGNQPGAVGGDTTVGADGSESATVGKVYYVSNDGDDSADGLTVATSFRTLKRAGEVLAAGDTVALQPGVYAERLTLEGFGNPDASTTIRGDGSGVVLDGGAAEVTAIWCEGCKRLVVEGLEIRNYTDAGLIIIQTEGLTVRRLTIHDNGAKATLSWVEGYGMHVENSKGVTIEDNEVYANGPSPQRPGRLMGTGIDTFGNTNVVIRKNVSRDNTGGGILVEDSVDVLVEENSVLGNDLDASAEDWWDGGLWVDGGHDVTVRNNVFTDNRGPALEISNEDNQNVFGYVVENNTITGNYYAFYIWNFGTPDLPPDNILRLIGNVVSGSTRQDIWIQALPCPPDDPCG